MSDMLCDRSYMGYWEHYVIPKEMQLLRTTSDISQNHVLGSSHDSCPPVFIAENAVLWRESRTEREGA